MLRHCRTIIFTLVLSTAPGIARAQRAPVFRVQARSDPPGAAVYVDGAAESAGVTPVWLRLARGEHALRLVRDGFAPAEQTVAARRNWQRVDVTLTPVGRLQLTMGDASAEGAVVTIDGEQAGSLPFERDLVPGRHRVTVARDGHLPMSRWFEIAGGQTYTVEIRLEPLPPARGSILVASDVSGAEVLVDGERVGETPLIQEVEPGEHLVELRPEGFEPHSSTVDVPPGQRVIVNPTLRPSRPPAATLRVLTEPDGALVSVNGEVRGAAPLTIADLPPGVHIIEARAEGFRAASERVAAEPEREVTVRLELERIPTTGTLRVTSTVDGAEVRLDGRPIGWTPAVRDGVDPGEHVVLVRAEGHRDWEHRFAIEAGQELTVHATPGGYGRLTVLSTTTGAEVLVDGEVVGTVPLRSYEVVAGDHEVVIRAPGHQPFTTHVSVAAGTTDQVRAELARAGEGADAGPAGDDGVTTPAQEVGQDHDGPRFTRSAIPLTPWAIAVDAAWGWPNLIGAYRIGLGVWEGLNIARVDVAVEARSSYYVTEFDVRARFGIRLARVVGLGAELSIGGGFGAAYPEDLGRRTEFVFGFTLYEGLELGPVALALTQRLEVFSDEYATFEDRTLQRQTGARVFVGGTLEVRIVRYLHIWALADYAPAQESRRVLCGGQWSTGSDICAREERGGDEHWMRDINLNVQAGLGLRFR